ncbi:RNA-dependent RNA polymerase family protein [Striga asiatica]|uniref:RNA-dependent RNA polymerase n=1 Tax=Striga asiatica TaxID=4170 RepID=A0A5A7QVC1_STRAF|nr:RNA-dependent RNA polymerase family protein [Striga asiatica]
MVGRASEFRLPESVEMMIERICLERDQPPLRNYTRQMLAMIGEQSSIKLLTTVLFYNNPITSFSGLVRRLVVNNHPIVGQTVLAKLDGGTLEDSFSSLSMDSPSSSHYRNSPRNISCQPSFEDESQGKMNFETQGKTSPSPKTQSPFACEFRETTGSGAISQQLTILKKLEFRKEKLEAVVTLAGAENIYAMKDLPMKDFETKMWDTYGQRFYAESDRSEYLAWDSGKTHLYYCHVCEDGSYNFKGPYLNSTRTHLQRSLGDDNILIVKFPKEWQSVIGNIMNEGILVGLKRYRFFVFKDERKKVKKNKAMKDTNTYSAVKCYFVRIDPVSPNDGDTNYILSGKTIREARCLFMHIHTISTIEKYMARLSLILSKTIKMEINFAAVKVETIEDIPFRDEKGSMIHDEDGKPILHTDGTGFISEDLAMKCPKDFSAAKYLRESSFEFVDFEQIAGQKREADIRNKEPPLLMQCRLFYNGNAVKGTLLVNKKLEAGTIQIRRSMIKVYKDETLPTTGAFNSLEIVNISHRPSRNYLSKYLIALLSYGGVPQEFFLNLLMNALEETRNVYSNRRAAIRVASNHDGLDSGFVAQRMISCGVPLNEPYLQHCLSNLECGEKTKLREGKIPVAESFYLMGTADPTGMLNYDEVCVILDNGPISGSVLVYRNPGMHFGDVHSMKAVYVKKLEEFIGNAKYGIFFSTKGCRQAAYEMATGDFDGDMYWVSRNPELLKYFRAHEPWHRVYSVPHSKKKNPQEFSELHLERELFQLFLEARTPSFSMATAADSWLAYMDRLLTLSDDRATEKELVKTKMIQLVDIYYDALDAPKSGKKVPVPDELKAELFPHHMERDPDISYESKSVLGQIYNTVVEYKASTVQENGIWKLPCLDVPVRERYLDMWRARYENYRKEMSKALKSSDESKNYAANEVINKYKQLLYEASDMEESQKDSSVIYDEAIAIYNVTYDYAMSHGVEKCGFAWRVAGSALCSLCAWQLASPNEKPVVILPSVLRDLLK